MSHLIIFDMEWNMGYQSRTFLYHGAEQVLRGEIIQIGAVKMEGSRIADTFQVTLRPRIFRKLHHCIAKITNLTQRDLNEGVPIAEGLKQFLTWCGRDAILGEWGPDDVPVLKQNLFLTGLDENWPQKWCDLQKLYTSQYLLKEGESLSLEHLVEQLGIEKDLPFHDALSDAVYTARVMQRIDLEKGLADYPDEEEQLRQQLCPAEKAFYDFTCWKGLVDKSAWRKSPKMQTACCPVCGKPLLPDQDDIWMRQGNNCLYSMAVCEQHGPVMIWLRRSHTDGLHYLFARATEKVDESRRAKWETDKKAMLERMRQRAKRKNLPAVKEATPLAKPQPKPLQRRPISRKSG